MDNIRVKNIRSLEDSGIIKLAPLTVLLGKNSSGKSTFLRLFPLFKQSWNTKNRGVLALYGDFVDFGEFSSLKTTNTKDDFVELDFDINISKTARYAYMFLEENTKEKIPCHCELKIKSLTNSDLLYCSSVVIKINGNVVSIVVDQNENITSFSVNSFDYKKYAMGIKAIYSGRSICFPVFAEEKSVRKNELFYPYPRFFILPLLDLINGLDKEKYLEIFHFFDMLPFSDRGTLTKILNSGRQFGESGKLIAKYLASKKQGKQCYNAILFSLVPSLLENIRMHLFVMSQNIFYSKPLRANAERYYRSQSLAVDEISPDGSNLASFITNMTPARKGRFDNWTQENFGFSIQIHREAGHQSVYLKEQNGISEYNVTDMGFGFSQIIPIITQLWDITNKDNTDHTYRCNDFIYAIEQPELHLHPALQVKTLKLFAEVIKVAHKNNANLRIIVETHSETMINYLGKLIRAKKISHEDVRLLIFEKKSASASTTIQESSYDNDGILENWPFGFFSTDGEVL